MNDLNILLEELNTWLADNDLEIKLIVIGAYAVHLHGISSRSTLDVDTLNQIHDSKVLKTIELIGEKYGLTSWLNHQAHGLILPEGFYDRTLSTHRFDHIHIEYASRIDLIKLKIAAYYYRHEFELKDLDDLKALNITEDEFKAGKAFLKKSIIQMIRNSVPSFMKTLKLS